MGAICCGRRYIEIDDEEEQRLQRLPTHRTCGIINGDKIVIGYEQFNYRGGIITTTLTL